MQRELLNEAAVKALWEDVQKAWDKQQDGTKDELKRVERELRKVERELTNLVSAVKERGISEALLVERSPAHTSL